MDFGLDPVQGEGHEAHATLGIETLDRLHQADIAFLDQVGVGQAIAEIATRHGDDEAQVGCDEAARGIQIAFVAEAAGKILFLVFGQHRHAVGGRNIGFDAAAGRRNGKLGKGQCVAHVGSPLL